MHDADERTRRRLAQISAAAAAQPLMLVGGALRDLLSGRPAHDVDLVLAQGARATAQRVAAGGEATYVELDELRDTARLVFRDGQVFDIAVYQGPDLLHDLAARDFTINAMALSVKDWLAARHDALIDPLNGRADLAMQLLRPCRHESLQEDPLRIIRAARFTAAYGLQPTLELLTAAAPALPGLASVAGERIGSELLRLCDAAAAARGLRLLQELGALTLIFPELRDADNFPQPAVHRLPVLEHSLEAVAGLDWLIDGGPAPLAVVAQPNLPRELPFADDYAALLGMRRGLVRRAALLKLAALLHDNAKPLTAAAQPTGFTTFYGHQTIGAERAATACRRLRLSRNDSEYVTQVIAEHMRPGQMRGSGNLTERAMRRFLRDTGDSAPDILLHELADHLATRTDLVDPEGWATHLSWVAACLHWYWAAPPPPLPTLLRGTDLIAELGLPAGPLIGQLLRAIGEAQIDGRISSRHEALALARELIVPPAAGD